MHRYPPTDERRPADRPIAILALLAALLAWAVVTTGCHANGRDGGNAPAPSPPEAQPTGSEAQPTPSEPEPSVQVTPSRGAPGSEVTVIASGFPPDTRLEIGAGPPRSEYEIFAEDTSDSIGRMRTGVRLPEWAEGGDTVIFAVSVPGSPVDALSEPFRVSAPAGGGGDEGAEEAEETVEVVGTLTDEGVECRALRGEDGELYTLAGGAEGFGVGDRVRVRGSVARMSFCMQGTTLEVESIEPASEG